MTRHSDTGGRPGKEAPNQPNMTSVKVAWFSSYGQIKVFSEISLFLTLLVPAFTWKAL